MYSTSYEVGIPYIERVYLFGFFFHCKRSKVYFYDAADDYHLADII
jgi:hypothetical protein